jgi:hypothetical protein
VPADLLLDQSVNAEFQFGCHVARGIFLQPIWRSALRQLKNPESDCNLGSGTIQCILFRSESRAFYYVSNLTTIFIGKGD